MRLQKKKECTEFVVVSCVSCARVTFFRWWEKKCIFRERKKNNCVTCKQSTIMMHASELIFILILFYLLCIKHHRKWSHSHFHIYLLLRWAGNTVAGVLLFYVSLLIVHLFHSPTIFFPSLSLSISIVHTFDVFLQ